MYVPLLQLLTISVQTKHFLANILSTTGMSLLTHAVQPSETMHDKHDQHSPKLTPITTTYRYRSDQLRIEVWNHVRPYVSRRAHRASKRPRRVSRSANNFQNELRWVGSTSPSLFLKAGLTYGSKSTLSPRFPFSLSLRSSSCFLV